MILGFEIFGDFPSRRIPTKALPRFSISFSNINELPFQGMYIEGSNRIVPESNLQLEQVWDLIWLVETDWVMQDARQNPMIQTLLPLFRRFCFKDPHQLRLWLEGYGHNNMPQEGGPFATQLLKDLYM